MAERVHPVVAEPIAQPESIPKVELVESGEHPIPRKSSPANYVIQVPKDTIYKYPPPGNDRRYKDLSRRRARCSFCRILCWLIFVIFVLVLAILVAAGILYIIFRPKAPSYSITSLTVKGFNVSDTLIVSPEFDVGVRASNPNKKIGIYYEKDSSVSVSNSGQQIVSGQIPAFYQGPENVTVFHSQLTGYNVRLSSAAHQSLIQGVQDGRVPLFVSLDVPLKIKVGSVKTWKVTVRVRCDVTVDKMTVNSNVVSKDCKYSVKALPF